MYESSCACLCYLLVFRGVTAPISFTNLEKSLAKSAPATCNVRAGPLSCSSAGQLYNAQTCRRIRTVCSSDDALSKPGIFLSTQEALSVKSRQAERRVTQTRRPQGVCVNHERSLSVLESLNAGHDVLCCRRSSKLRTYLMSAGAHADTPKSVITACCADRQHD